MSFPSVLSRGAQQAIEGVASVMNFDLVDSTNTSYSKWQTRWVDWCVVEQQYISGITVTPEHLTHFIWDKVLVFDYDAAGKEAKKKTRAKGMSDAADAPAMPGNEYVDDRGVTRPEVLRPREKGKKGKKRAAGEVPASLGGTEGMDGVEQPEAGRSVAGNEGRAVSGSSGSGSSGSKKRKRGAEASSGGIGEELKELKTEMTGDAQRLIAELTASNGPRRVPVGDVGVVEDVQQRMFAGGVERLVNSPVAASTVNQCASALVKLYKSQVHLKTASPAHPPRGAAIAAIIAGLQKVEARRKRLECADKGVNSINDGIQGQQQLRDSYASFLRLDTKVGLRGLVGHTIGFNALLRGDNQRYLCLSDLSSRLVPGEESPNAVCLIVGLDRTKTDKDGKTKYVGIIRSKDVLTCGVFFIAFFHDDSERYPHSTTSFPDMTHRTHWYKLPFLAQNRDTTVGIKVHTQISAMGTMLKETEVRTKKKTHAGRSGGAQMLEERGVAAGEIARAGRWDQSVMEVSYLKGLSWPSMRALAGFEPQGSCFLPRDVPVPATLLVKVFPEVEKWMALLKSPEYQRPPLQDTGGIYFLEMLQRLRVTFLQDVPHWRRHMPDFYLWKQPLFSDPEYLAWEEVALRQTGEQEHNYDYRIRTAMPILCDRLSDDSRIQQEWFRRLYEQGEAARKEERERHERTERLERVLCLLAEEMEEQGRQQGQFRATFASNIISQLQLLLAPPSFTSSSTPSLEKSPPAQANSSAENTSHLLAQALAACAKHNDINLASSSSVNPVGSGAVSPSFPPISALSPALTTSTHLSRAPPAAPIITPTPRINPSLVFRMDRHSKTITELWREYAIGRGVLQPMKHYYETPGSKICKQTHDSAELKFYQRRKKILDVVELLGDASFGKDYVHAASQLESWRARWKKPEMSLNALGDKIGSMTEAEKLSILTSHPVSDQPSSTRASFSTLPTEILTIIISHITHSSAACLSRVARRFTTLCDPAIWREIRLSLNPHYGEQPLVQPYPRNALKDYDQWAKAEAKQAEERRREGLREKVKTIMVQANKRRLGMVEKVVVVPRPGALVGILAFLDMVAAGITVLELSGPARHTFEQAWRPADYDTLDMKFLDVKLSFPVLTHLIIRKGSIRFPDFVAVLCEAAPDLVSLDVDIAHDDDVCPPEWGDSKLPDYPVGQLLSTKLRQLRLAYSDVNDDSGWSANGVQQIVMHSPLLEQVSVRFYPEPEQHGDWDDILGALSNCAHLTDLHLRCDLYEFKAGMGQVGAGGESFPALRRLCLSMNGDLDFLGAFPQVPVLETLILEHVDGQIPRCPTYHLPSSDLSPPTMLPELVAGLSGSPKLRSIYSLSRGTTSKSLDVLALLDDIETSGTLTGVVRSLHRRREHIIHARMLLHHFELPGDTLGPMDCDALVSYTAADGTKCGKRYDTLPGLESAWQDYIHYDGLKVPLEVLEEMALAAGVGVEEWVGRGIDVGEKAWKVLRDWRDAQLALEAEEGA